MAEVSLDFSLAQGNNDRALLLETLEAGRTGRYFLPLLENFV